mgnify:CR=1 FL=1
MQTATNTPPRQALSGPAQPWWRVRMVWLVLALPLSAVVAGTTTAIIAISDPDPVVRGSAQAPAERPAVEGRNHATTGGQKP